jgi:VanZ family protein
VSEEEKTKPPRRRPFRWWRLAVPLALMGAVATGWVGTVETDTIPVSDKLLHFLFYGALTFAWVFALAPLRARPIAVVGAAFALAVGWGLMDEALQSLTDHRTASLLDAGADVLGAGVACLVSLPLLGWGPGRAPSAARK